MVGRWTVMAAVALLAAGCSSHAGTTPEFASTLQLVRGADGNITVLPAEAPAPTGKGSIHGVVVDEGIHPLGTAIIILATWQASVHADPGGRFAFTGLDEGFYWVRADAPGHEGVRTLVEVKATEATSVRFVLQSDPTPAPYNQTLRFRGHADTTQLDVAGGFLNTQGCSACRFVVPAPDGANNFTLQIIMPGYSGIGTGSNRFAYTIADASTGSTLENRQGPNPLAFEVKAKSLAKHERVAITVNPISSPVPEVNKDFQMIWTQYFGESPPTGWETRWPS